MKVWDRNWRWRSELLFRQTILPKSGPRLVGWSGGLCWNINWRGTSTAGMLALGHPHVASSYHHAPQLGSQSQPNGSWAKQGKSYELYLLFLAKSKEWCTPRKCKFDSFRNGVKDGDRFSPEKFSPDSCIELVVSKEWYNPKKCSLDSVELVHRGVKASGIPSRSNGFHVALA